MDHLHLFLVFFTSERAPPKPHRMVLLSKTETDNNHCPLPIQLIIFERNRNNETVPGPADVTASARALISSSWPYKVVTS